MSNSVTQILLVEDEPAHTELILRAFAKRAGQVSLTVAGTLREARHCLTQDSPDLMITDLLLPDGVGTDLFPPSESEFQFPVVLMTSHGNEQVAVEAMKAGVLDYVIKSSTSLAEMPRIADRVLRQWEDRMARKHTEEELSHHREHLEELVGERTSELAKANVQLLQEIADRQKVERELRQSQEALRESQLLSTAVLDQTFQFIGLLKPDGTLVRANRTALNFVDVEESDVLGKPFWETAWWTHSQELQEQLRDAIGRAATGELVRFGAFHPAADGDMHYVDFSLKPVRDEQGEIAFLIPEGRDISELKKAEEVIRKEQQLLRELLNLQEQERRLVAYEIHDGLAQQLAGAQMSFQAFEQSLQCDDEARDVFDRGLALLGESLAEARRLISGLRPPILDESGVVDAVEYLVREVEQRDGIQVEFLHHVAFDRLPPSLETAIFRIVQETLNNAARHSQGDKARVELTQREDRIHLEIQDWGIGFDPEQVEEDHFGLRGIRERARLFAGHALIDTTLGEGTRIVVEFPIVGEATPEPAFASNGH